MRRVVRVPRCCSTSSAASRSTRSVPYPSFDDYVAFGREIRSVMARVPYAAFVGPLTTLRKGAASGGDSAVGCRDVDVGESLRGSGPVAALNSAFDEWTAQGGFAPTDEALHAVFVANALREHPSAKRSVAVRILRQLAAERRWPVPPAVLDAALTLLGDCEASLRTSLTIPPIVACCSDDPDPRLRRARRIFTRIVIPVFESLSALGVFPKDAETLPRLTHSNDERGGVLARAVQGALVVAQCFAVAFNDSYNVSRSSLAASSDCAAALKVLRGEIEERHEATVDVMRDIDIALTSLVFAAYAASAHGTADTAAMDSLVARLRHSVTTQSTAFTVLCCVFGASDEEDSPKGIDASACADAIVDLGVVQALPLCHRSKQLAAEIREACRAMQAHRADDDEGTGRQQLLELQARADSALAELRHALVGATPAAVPILVAAHATLSLALIMLLQPAMESTAACLAEQRMHAITATAQDWVESWRVAVATVCAPRAGIGTAGAQEEGTSAETLEVVFSAFEWLARISITSPAVWPSIDSGIGYDKAVQSRLREWMLSGDDSRPPSPSAAAEASIQERERVLRGALCEVLPPVLRPLGDALSQTEAENNHAVDVASATTGHDPSTDQILKLTPAAAEVAAAVAPMLCAMFAPDQYCRCGPLVGLLARLRHVTALHGVVLALCGIQWATDANAASSAKTGRALITAESPEAFRALGESLVSVPSEDRSASHLNSNCTAIALLPVDAYEAAYECFRDAGNVDGLLLLRRAAEALHDPHGDDLVFDLFNLSDGS